MSRVVMIDRNIANFP